MKWLVTAVMMTVLLLANPVAAEWYRHDFNVMGTSASVELWSENQQQADLLIAQVVAEMERINQLLSPYIESSELYRVNQLAATEAQNISPEFYWLLQRSIDFSKLSQGAFDITFASVGYRFQYRESVAPSEEFIQQHKALIDFRSIELYEAGQVKFSKPNTRIDLGGIAKGYAVDRCIELLQKAQVAHAFVKAGGDSRVLGDKRGRLWTIGIQHPRQPGAVLTQLPLENVAISTSGDYERFFIKNGERVHHIIDPTTGHSANKSISVTILANDSTTADALSTTVFILGPERGLKLIETLNNVSAIIIDSKGQFHYSSDLQPQ
ncbi:MAG: FAD:protein FMN transferase [Gammaproteobacteria bacterium]|nr:FAD:protein FMN transferase [Gammaproteobacteria bacterium]